MLKVRFSRPLILVSALAAAVVVAAALGAVLILGAQSENEHPDDADAFLARVEVALSAQGETAHVTAEGTAANGQTRFPMWASEAWYDFEAGVVRTSVKRAPGSSLDIADEVVHIRTRDAVFVAYPGSDEQVNLLAPNENPACFYTNEPETPVVGLLCGLGPQEGDYTSLTVEEGTNEFRGAPVRVLRADMDDGRVLRLLVDAETYVPVGQTMGGAGAPPGVLLETAFAVDNPARGSWPPDLFDPRSIGYVPLEELWLQVLDAPDLGMPVFWPGRSVSGADGYDAVLSHVDDRRGPPGKNTPGHVLTLTYQGSNGLFRLDYWPGGTWQEFVALLDDGFAFGECTESVTAEIPSGELTILRGHEPFSGPGALDPPQIATPGAPAPTPAPSTYRPFPDGCPEGEHDRFMAVILVDGGIVTINASYGFCCQDGQPFGAFDAEEGLRAIAERLRLRQPGE